MVEEYLQPELFRISKKIMESPDSFTLELSSDEKKELFFSPGQFNMLYAFGVGESAISLSGSPYDRNTFVHTVKTLGNVTRALSRLEVGECVGVRGPFGSAWPLEAAKKKNVLLVAGGIGLAPLRSAIYSLLNNRQDFGAITLLYGARDPGDLLYLNELEQWAIDVHLTVDFADESWRKNVGVVSSLIKKVPIDPANTIAFVCGPEVMIRFTIRELRAFGIPADSLYLSMERNMKCAVGHCGRCQFVSEFLCKDGPVFSYQRIQPFFGKAEV